MKGSNNTVKLTVTDIWFPIAFVLLICLAMLFFGLGPMVLLAFVLTLFIPGYFLSGVIFKSKFHRTLLAAPFSIVFITTLLYLLGLVGIKVINPLFLIICNLLCIGIWFVSKKFSDASIKLPEPSKIIKLFLIILVVISFVRTSVYAGGWEEPYSYEIPRVITTDHSHIISYFDWAVESETITVPPWMNFNNEGMFMADTPPASLIPPSLFSSFAGIEAHNGYLLYQILLASTLIFVVFFTISVFFNDIMAFASSLFIAFPIEIFLLADIGGATRNTLGALFFILIVSGAWFLYKSEKRAGIFLGLMSLGLLMSHAPLAIGLLIFIPLFLINYKQWFKKKEFYVNIGIVIVLLLLALPYVIPTVTARGSSGFDPLSLPSIEDFEERVGLIGPVIQLKHIDYLLVPALIASSYLIFVLYRYSKTILNLIGKRKFWFVVLILYMILVTSGVIAFSVQFQSKMRHELVAFLIAPPILYTFNILFIQFFKRKPPKALFVFLAMLLIVVSFTKAFDQTSLQTVANFEKSFYYQIEKLNEYNWETMLWLRNNTSEDATVLAVGEFVQNSVVLSQRTSASIESFDINTIATYGLISTPSFSFENFWFKPLEEIPESVPFFEFDYIVVRIAGMDTAVYDPLHDAFLQKGFNTLFDNGVDRVYSKLK